MKIKVCGLKYKDNLNEVASLNPDYIGFIHYSRSGRYMAETLTKEDLKNISSVKTAVFVNPTLTEITKSIQLFGYNALQFHGNESPDLCESFRSDSMKVIKAFSVNDEFNFNFIKDYHGKCDYFLFDTKGKEEGGNGFSFNWNILKQYDQKTPFFLSGGIGTDNIHQVMELTELNIYGIDINSKVESEVGVKDISKVKEVIKIIREN